VTISLQNETAEVAMIVSFCKQTVIYVLRYYSIRIMQE
jgi:hypothetical protein